MVKSVKKKKTTKVVKDDDDFTGEQVFSPDNDDALKITGVFLVYDHGDYIKVYDIPASEFDGRRGHKALEKIRKAHGTYINADNEVEESLWLYNMISPMRNIWFDNGKQATEDGPWFKYEVAQDRFLVIQGNHHYAFAGFGQ